MDEHMFISGAVEARQVAPLTVRQVAGWCGGAVSVDDAGNQGVDLPTGRAGYGDWVLADGTVIGPVEFNRTYRSVEVSAGG